MAETKTPSGKVFEEMFQNMRTAAEATLKMQQETMKQFTSLLPSLPSSQSAVIEKMRDFQKQWSNTVSDLARKHRDVVDRQYQAALESLDEALRFAESSNPEEFRKRSEQLIRKTIDCVKESADAQLNEFKDAANRWTELVTKTEA